MNPQMLSILPLNTLRHQLYNLPDNLRLLILISQPPLQTNSLPHQLLLTFPSNPGPFNLTLVPFLDLLLGCQKGRCQVFKHFLINLALSLLDIPLHFLFFSLNELFCLIIVTTHFLFYFDFLLIPNVWSFHKLFHFLLRWNLAVVRKR